MTLEGIAGALGIGPGWGARALARAVGAGAGEVAALSEAVARALEHAGRKPLRATVTHGRVPLEDASAEALCASGLPPADAAPIYLGECARVVRTGGRVLVATAAGLTRRGPDRALVSALFLHAGLVDIEQRLSRGTVITSGRVRR